MHSYSSARDLAINGGRFIDNTGVYNEFRSERSGLKILSKNVAPGAFHNSGERFDPPKCLPNTRVAVLEKIMSWVRDSRTTSTPILWLYGPAGAGKSAIVQTIAEECERLGFLAASFFFSRTAAERNNEKRLVPTIAYQLISFIPAIRPLITKAVEDDPLVFTLSLEAQIRHVITIPISKMYFTESGRPGPVVITIDGLDECHGGDAQRLILTALVAALSQQGLDFSCLVASRPEQVIRDTFNSSNLNGISCRIILDDSFHPEIDIRHFLHHSFTRLKETHCLGKSLLSPWPSRGAIETFVRKSSGQFIFADTVVKYIASPRRHPAKSLEIVLGLESFRGDTPFAQLDALYCQILMSADNVDSVLLILSLILFKPSLRNPRQIELLLSLEQGEVALALIDLHSILQVPEPSHDEYFSSSIHILHASLVDFLMDSSRSGVLFIGDNSMKLAHCCLKYIIMHPLTRCDAQVLTRRDALTHATHAISMHFRGLLGTTLWHDRLDELWDGIDHPNLARVLGEMYKSSTSRICWQKDMVDLTFWSETLHPGAVPGSESQNKIHSYFQMHFDNFLKSELDKYPLSWSEGFRYFLVLVSAGCSLDLFLKICGDVDQPPPDGLSSTAEFDQTALHLQDRPYYSTFQVSAFYDFLDSNSDSIQSHRDSYEAPSDSPNDLLTSSCLIPDVRLRSPEFYRYLSSFLGDSRRSGRYWITGETYAQVATGYLRIILKNITHRVSQSRKGGQDIDTSSLYAAIILGDLNHLLVKASPSQDLSDCLKQFANMSEGLDLPAGIEFRSKRVHSMAQPYLQTRGVKNSESEVTQVRADSAESE